MVVRRGLPTECPPACVIGLYAHIGKSEELWWTGMKH